MTPRSSPSRSGRRGPGPGYGRTLRASTPTDLLATVPYLLGFHPEQSVVVVTLGSTSTPVHARHDLPRDLDDLPLLVADLVPVILRAGVGRLALVVYTDDEVAAAAVSRPLLAALRQADVEVPVAVRADAARWHCLGDDSGACPGDCPADGTPYDLTTHPFTTEAVVEGRVVLPNREALRDTLSGAEPAEIERVAIAVEEAVERHAAAARSPLGPPNPAGGRRHLVAEGRWVQQRLRRFVDERARLDSQEVGRLVADLVCIEIRDVAWAEVHHEVARTQVDLWRDVVRRTPAEFRAAPATVLAFAAWLSGQGALAWCALDLAQEADAGYSMAALLEQLFASGMPPHALPPLPEEALSLFQ